MSGVRIDKFLWAVRIFKTRAISADACKKGKIEVNEKKVKPSYMVSVDDNIVVTKLPISYQYKVKELTGKRVGAKLVSNLIDDLTPDTELDKLEMQKLGINLYRKKGEGRPTKRDRRMLDDIRAE